MKTTKRALSLILALVLVLSISIPALAAEDYPIWVYNQDGPVILYKSLLSGESHGEFSLAWRAKNFTIKRSSIKVTPGTTGATVYNLYKHYTVDNYEEEKLTSTREGYYYRINLKFVNTGDAKVSFKAGGKTYSINVKILDYENPLKTLKITGIKNGKNMASIIKNGFDVDNPKTIPFNSTIKSVKLNAAAATGWIIKQIVLEDKTNGQYRMLGGDSGMNSGTINWGTLNVKHNYGLHIHLQNKTDLFSYYLTLNLKGAKAP